MTVRFCRTTSVIHGGVITSILDQAIALEAWNAADRNPTVTVQMDTRFLKASHAGDFLEVSVKIRHMTRSLIFVDAKMYCGLSQIADASAIMKIVHNLKESNG
ncbi:MAG: PaaI family thioesterase [Rhodobacteraceae bacterium]|nr:PaaI family thioesterase [Paracoccaceae bacterium]